MFPDALTQLRAGVQCHADAIRVACQAEATAPKPGNVHPSASFEDCHYRDFCRAAEVTAHILASSDCDFERSLGERVLHAIEATRRVTNANVNLGIVLLIAPLTMVREDRDVTRVLASLSARDAAQVYRAIRLASPGGMKSEAVDPSRDVTRDEADVLDLIDAMRSAAGRDRIARQYAENYRDFFHGVVPIVESELRCTVDPNEAIVRAQLRLMSLEADSLIARKLGPSIAEETRSRAEACLRHDSPEARTELDMWLRADGNRRNPGTTADFIAAAIYWLIRPAPRAWSLEGPLDAPGGLT